MNAGFWTAPGGAEQAINVFPMAEESLNASSGSLTAAGALAKLAALDSAHLPGALDGYPQRLVGAVLQRHGCHHP